MSNCDPDVKEFLEALNKLARFLVDHKSGWAQKVQKCADEVSSFNINGLVRFNSYCGGMGSLNDLYFGNVTDQYYDLLGCATKYAHKLTKKPYHLLDELGQSLNNLATFLVQHNKNSSWGHRIKKCANQVNHYHINGLMQFILYCDGNNSLNDLHFGEFNDKYTDLLDKAKKIASKTNKELNRESKL